MEIYNNENMTELGRVTNTNLIKEGSIISVPKKDQGIKAEDEKIF